MKRVTGLGGVFFKAKNPNEMKTWYETHLGIPSGQYGMTFEWNKTDQTDQKGFTAWSMFDDTTTYLEPSEKEFMINYRVENLEALIPILKAEGIQVVGEIESFEYGKFAWILDPEGNKIELWQPNDEEYQKILGVKIEST